MKLSLSLQTSVIPDRFQQRRIRAVFLFLDRIEALDVPYVTLVIVIECIKTSCTAGLDPDVTHTDVHSSATEMRSRHTNTQHSQSKCTIEYKWRLSCCFQIMAVLLCGEKNKKKTS